VSKDTSGNVIATLWLDNNHQEAWGWNGTASSSSSDEIGWNRNLGDHYGFTNGGLYSDWSDDWRNSTAGAYPSNMYGTSYIRAETLNNGGYYAISKSALSETEVEPSSSNPFALYTMSQYGLTSYITTPSQMTWMQGETLYAYPNESTTADKNYSSKDGCYNWISDYLWLPSITEMGFIGDSTGIWRTNAAERSTYDWNTYGISSSSTIGTANTSSEASVFSCTRSADPVNTSTSYCQDPSGTTFGAYSLSVSGCYAVRAALLLNLKSAASYVATPSEGTSIVLNKNDGTGELATVAAGDSGSLPSSVTVPTRTGYSFMGYYTGTGASGNMIYDSSGNLSASGAINSNISLYAMWGVAITFDKQSGSGGTSSITATVGFAMPEITQPSRTGYTFGGYYTSTGGGGTQYYISGAISCMSVRACDLTGATTLYAKWTANTYSVTLDNQSATAAGTASVQATYGSAMPTLTSLPTKTGYIFDGYYTETNGGGTKYYTASGTSARNCDFTSAKTLYAKWTINAYTVTLNTNGGTINSGNITEYTPGTAVTLPTDVTRAGYTFGGWYESSTFSGTAVTSISSTDTGNKTYYAKWTGKAYNITVNCNGGSGPSSTTYTVAESTQTKTISNPTRSNFTFNGWTITCSGGLPIISGTTLTIPANCYGDITMTAKWNATITVAESISGVADVLTGGGTVAEGASMTLTAYPKAGYGLKCWLKNGEEFSGNVSCKITITVDGNATYTAVFAEIGVNVEEFLVASTYGGVAYVVGKEASSLADADTITVMTEYYDLDYTFVGWYLDNDRTNCLSTDMTYFVPKSTAYKHVLVAVYRAGDE